MVAELSPTGGNVVSIYSRWGAALHLPFSQVSLFALDMRNLKDLARRFDSGLIHTQRKIGVCPFAKEWPLRADGFLWITGS